MVKEEPKSPASKRSKAYSTSSANLIRYIEPIMLDDNMDSAQPGRCQRTGTGGSVQVQLSGRSKIANCLWQSTFNNSCLCFQFTMEGNTRLVYHMYHVPSGGRLLAHLKQHNVNIFSVLLSGIFHVNLKVSPHCKWLPSGSGDSFHTAMSYACPNKWGWAMPSILGVYMYLFAKWYLLYRLPYSFLHLII